MKISIFAILFSATLFGCKNSSQNNRDTLIYEVVNDFFARTVPPYAASKLLSSKEIMPDLFIDFDGTIKEIPDTFALKKQDFEYMIRQQPLHTTFELKQDKLKNVTLIDYNEIAGYVSAHGAVDWKKLTEKTHISKFSTISVPYFSLDHSIALFRVCEYSSTYYEEGGQILLFKKINGKWEFLLQDEYWESSNWYP